jgi:uncharacterized protein
MAEAPTMDDAPTDAGPAKGRAARERTCIVTRTVRDPDDHLIRFVIGPDGAVVPDLKARLPGRGAWVTATRTSLSEAIRRRLFQRAFRREVVAEADLPDRVDQMLEERALAALSLANKAGAVITGFAKVEAAIASTPLATLLHAHDASADGRRKLDAALARAERAGAAATPVMLHFTSAQLDLALGRLNVVHAAVLAGSAGEHFRARCAAVAVYRSGQVPEAEGQTVANEP